MARRTEGGGTGGERWRVVGWREEVEEVEPWKVCAEEGVMQRRMRGGRRDRDPSGSEPGGEGSTRGQREERGRGRVDFLNCQKVKEFGFMFYFHVFFSSFSL